MKPPSWADKSLISFLYTLPFGLPFYDDCECMSGCLTWRNLEGDVQKVYYFFENLRTYILSAITLRKTTEESEWVRGFPAWKRRVIMVCCDKLKKVTRKTANTCNLRYCKIKVFRKPFNWFENTFKILLTIFKLLSWLFTISITVRCVTSILRINFEALFLFEKVENLFDLAWNPTSKAIKSTRNISFFKFKQSPISQPRIEWKMEFLIDILIFMLEGDTGSFLCRIEGRK